MALVFRGALDACLVAPGSRESNYNPQVMSSEDSGKENHLPVEDLDQAADVTADAAERREVTNSSDADGLLLPSEKKTSLGEEPAAENGRDLPSDRGEIASLGKEQDGGDKAKEQSPADKTDHSESRNGITGQ